MYFFINVAGLSPLLAGLIPGLGKVWDAVSDPWVGYISDNTKSKFGRRRVYFLFAIIPILISSTLIWLPVHFDNQLYTFILYFIAYLFFYTVSTMTMVPYSPNVSHRDKATPEGAFQRQLLCPGHYCFLPMQAQ